MLEILILAAGKGTRMRSDLPKVLHKLAGKPLLEHVVDAANALGAAQTCVVYGFGGEAVPLAMAAHPLTFVLQAEQLGTGHAVRQVLTHLADDSVSLVLYGDVPLTRTETLRPLVGAAQAGRLGLLTVTLAQPDGYGRIVRDNGNVTRIVEHKDASAVERLINEVNTGILAVPTRHLKKWIAALTNDNAQREYYLTDIIALAVQDGISVETHQPASQWEVMGVNSKSQLAELERIHQHEIAQVLLEAGVTLFDPARLDVRGKLVCGRDVQIDVNCVFEGQVFLGDGTFVEKMQKRIAKHQRNDVQIPIAHRRSPAKSLAEIEKSAPTRNEAIRQAHGTGAYSYQPSAEYFSVHFTTVGRVARAGAEAP